MKHIYFVLLAFPLSVFSQTIVNDYYAVTALTGTTATVTSTTGTQGIYTLAVGDTVLLIQMQGAAIDQTNTSSFGTPTYNNAGNYEINVICGISGNQVGFKFALKNTYTAGSGLQIVSHQDGKLATFTTPSGGVTGQAWNGATGGVIFIKATTIYLGNPSGTPTIAVNANGIGFRGGAAGGIPGAPGTVCNTNVVTSPGNSFLWNNSGCNGAISTSGATGYFYPKLSLPLPVGGVISSPPAPTSPPANLNDQYVGGWKGEGIATYVTNMETGRGKQANGGGGGQVHNSGGAGGGMYGAGGAGGNQWSGASPAAPYANGGVGGAALNPSATKLYMGGGGGGGQANYPNGDASAGGNGGGIILFRGTTLTYATGAIYSIQANGSNNVPKLDNDSEGGGGAGGSIYFDVSTITLGATGLWIYANGGTGGNATNSGDCIGPGGGGGGGYILSRAAIPGSVVTTTTGGASGVTTGVNTGQPCTGASASWGAAAGSNGAVSSGVSSFTTPLGTSVVSCSLPVTMESFTITNLTDKIILNWSTAAEKNNNYFVVERSADGVHFDSIAYNKGAGNSTALLNYSFTDNTPENGSNYYRIKQVDFNGQYTYSSVRYGNVSKGYGIISVYPQPLQKPEKLTVRYLLSQKSELFIQIMDALGKEVYSNSLLLNSGYTLVDLNIDFPPGIYCLIISSQDGTQTRKIIIE